MNAEVIVYFMRIFKWILKIIGITLIALLGIIVIVCIAVSLYINKFNPEIINVSLKKASPIKFTCYGEEVNLKIKECIPIPFSKMPRLLQKSYLGIVPQDYKPNGTDIIRYIIIDMRGPYGGFYDPTIYEQLAHNSLIIRNGAWPSLSEENALAVKIYERYTKEKILERYINLLYFGQGIFGYEAAAQYYYGKSVTALETDQMALLAGISSGYYSSGMNSKNSFLKKERLIKIRNSMLDRMVWENSISEAEAKACKRKPLGLRIKVNER